jgi:hypothetical protein
MMSTPQPVIVNVGSSNINPKKITVTLPRPSELTVIPIVLATPLQNDPNYPAGSIPDTFAVTITGVSETQFTANIFRVDANAGWGQNLFLAYIAFGAFTALP